MNADKMVLEVLKNIDIDLYTSYVELNKQKCAIIDNLLDKLNEQITALSMEHKYSELAAIGSQCQQLKDCKSEILDSACTTTNLTPVESTATSIAAPMTSAPIINSYNEVFPEQKWISISDNFDFKGTTPIEVQYQNTRLYCTGMWTNLLCQTVEMCAKIDINETINFINSSRLRGTKNGMIRSPRHIEALDRSISTHFSVTETVEILKRLLDALRIDKNLYKIRIA